MTSGSFFSNRITERIKNRLWSLALVSLMLFTQIPMTAAAIVTRHEDYSYLLSTGLSEELMEQTIRRMLAASFTAAVSGQNPLLILEVLAAALLLAVSGFAYLYRTQQADFYHSLPVARTELFRENYLIGAAFFVIPYAVNLALGVLIMLARVGDALETGLILCGFVTHTVFFFCLYSVFILAVMLTGTLLTGVLGGLVLISWGSLAVGVLSLYMQTFQLTRVWDTAHVWRLIAAVSPIGLYELAAYDEKLIEYLLAGAAVAVAAALIARVLYKRRMLETAGRAMSFAGTEPVIKYMIALPAALLGGLLFYTIMEMTAWGLFGLLFTGTVACSVIEVIYRGDFKQVFGGRISTAAVLISALALFAAFRLDLTGFDSYHPADGQVDSVSIAVTGLSPETQWNYYAEPVMEEDLYGRSYITFHTPDPADLLKKMGPTEDAALADALISDGLANTLAARNAGYSTANHNTWLSSEQDQGAAFSQVYVRWLLKDGREIFRTYYVNTVRTGAAIEALYGDMGFRRGTYPILKLKSSDIAAVNYREWDDPMHVEFADDAAKDRLFDSWKREFEAMTAAERETESPVAALQFKTVGVQAAINELRKTGDNYTVFNEYYYYPVYPSFSETIAVLEECGIYAGRMFTEEDIESVTVNYYGDREWTDADELSLVITDKAMIREILRRGVRNGLGVSDTFRPACSTLSSEGIMRKSTDGYGRRMISLRFAPDDVPAFILEYYRLTPEQLRRETPEPFSG